MALGGGFGNMGMGGQSALDFQTLGRGFSTVTLIDVIVAHSPLWYTLLTGFVSGILLWSIPLAFVCLNFVISRMAGATVDLFANRVFGVQTAWFVLGTGGIGALLAVLRRASARRKKYVEFGNFTLGLNSVAATLAGLLIAVGLVLSGSTAGVAIWLLGMGAPLIGFMVDGLWQLFNDRLLRWFGRPDMEVLLGLEAETFLQRHPGLYGFRLDEVKVRDRTASVRGHWEDRAARDRVHGALLCVEGIDNVRFEKT